MKLLVAIQEIDYGDVAARAMPLLERAAKNQNRTVALALEAISRLPDALIYDVICAIPENEKRQIVAAAATDYQDEIVRAVNRLSMEQGIGVTISSLSVDPSLTVRADVANIDYGMLAERFLPTVRQKLMDVAGKVPLMRTMIARASAEQLCGLMDRFLGSGKDALVIELVHRNKAVLIELIECAAQKHGIHLKLADIYIY